MIYANENLRAKREPLYSPMLAEKKLEHIEISNYRDFIEQGVERSERPQMKDIFCIKRRQTKIINQIFLYIFHRETLFSILTIVQPPSRNLLGFLQYKIQQ